MKTTKSFNQYLAENPQVYEEFKRLTFIAIHKGAKKLGGQQICEVIRWYSLINHNDIYKVNNTYVAGLVRKFENDYPIYRGIFTKRASAILVE